MDLLGIIGGFALLFYVAGLLFARRARSAADGAAEITGTGAMQAQLPALSALLPFVLLVMASQRLNLPTPNSLFGLALLLTALTLGLARLLLVGSLPLCALGGVAAVVYAWAAKHFAVDRAATLLGWIAVFYFVFSAFPFAFHRSFRERRGPWLAAALVGPALFPLTYFWVKRAWPNDAMGVLPALFAVFPIVGVFLLLRNDPLDHPRRLGRLALFGGIALLFITLIFPIQLERQWITIAWALEAVAVLWLYGRVPHRALPIAALLLLGTTFVRLAVNPAVFRYHLHTGQPILNVYLYTYATVILCHFAAARLLQQHEVKRVLGLRAAGWLNAIGGILLFLLLNIEIADYFNRDRSGLTFDFSGNLARDLAYTVVWSLYALALLILGIWKRARGVRYAAIALLAATLLKLFLHDLAQLAQLYRIVALFAVASVAILASFLYQRFLPSDEKQPPVS
jgi:uncharacterized membrane protein